MVITIYKEILEKIKASKEDREKVMEFSNKLISRLYEYADEENIEVECRLVGSMAKKTSLIGKADIDIFMAFPLDFPEKKLKEYGLKFGKKCIEEFNGKRELRYASHPYITGFIEDYEIDFVPCYKIKDSSELKSAVDRTILHTDYVQTHLTDEEADQVLLLKKFMASVNTYGANFRVSGFSGYLCELLILKYHSFEKVIEAASNQWKRGFKIDLENYGTSDKFKEVFIVIDPVDENRNVAAALSMQKLSEFILASRNYMKNPSETYFHEKNISVSKEELLDEFEKRGSKCYVLSFNVPELSEDIIYSQIEKTMKSFVKVSEMYDFNLIENNYYIDSENRAHIILEYEIDELANVKIHTGPQIKYKTNGFNFKKKYPNAYIIEDKWIAISERKYKNVKEMIDDIVKKENRNILKLGKNIKDEITYNYSLEKVEVVIDKENKEDYNNLFMHLYPDYLLNR